MQENTEMCAGSIYPEKIEKCKSSRPENRQGSISIGPGKFARGVKCAPRPPANPAPSGPARTRRPRPRIAGPDAPGRPRTPPGQPRSGPRCRPCQAPPRSHQPPGPAPAPRSAKDARKDAKRPTFAPDQPRPRWTGRNHRPGPVEISPAPWKLPPRPAAPGGPRRTGRHARKN